MKKVWLFSVLAVAVVFSGCTKNNTGTSDANVMFVNGCAGAGVLVAKINGNTANGANYVNFQANSGYQYLPSDVNLNIDLYIYGLGNLLTSGTANFTPSGRYSVFSAGLATAVHSFVVTTDALPTLPTGKAAVRFINLSSDSLNETFSIGSEQLDSNIGYTVSTPFIELTAATGVGVSVIDPSYTQPAYIATLSNQTFTAGKIYTIMLTGSHTSATGSSSALQLTIINNN